jgi:hypothetical protein
MPYITLTLVVLSKNNKILIIVNLAFHSFFLRTTGSAILLSLVTRKLDSRRTQNSFHMKIYLIKKPRHSSQAYQPQWLSIAGNSQYIETRLRGEKKKEKGAIGELSTIDNLNTR